MNAVYVDGFRRKKQFIVGEVPDAKSVALFWCMIKQNQIEQVIVLNEPGADEALFLPEQSERMIYNGITVTHLREYYMKNCKIISCGLENVQI
jgi:Protein-tyrosine phosphatase